MNEIMIGNRKIGRGSPVYVIAEIGSNHDGRIERAFAMIEVAAYSGADAVKFQSFTADGLVARNLRTARGGFAPNPAYGFIKSLSLPEDWHPKLKEAARAAGVDFISAPFDLQRLELLDELNVPAIKIASGDLTYEPLLRAAARTMRPLIVSTGMSTFDEIAQALQTIREEGNEKVVLLHCVTSYPTKAEDENILAVAELEKRFGLPVGLSDHGRGIAAPVAAVALGAAVVERHITISRGLSGPDHSYAMEPGEFRQMVEEIRLLEKALGTGRKFICDEERRERFVGRRSIRAAADLPKGTVLKIDHLKFVRPGEGLSPFLYRDFLGKKLMRGVREDEALSYAHVGIVKAVDASAAKKEKKAAAKKTSGGKTKSKSGAEANRHPAPR